MSIAYHFNEKSDAIAKLYPLIIFLVGVILFILVYFFRGIQISGEEISDVGLFSAKDRAVINKGKTLIVTMKKHSRLTVELFGNDGTAPALDWLKDENYQGMDIYLYRGRAIGGKGAVKRILSIFDISPDDYNAIFSNETFRGEYEYSSITAEKREDIRIIKIKVTETV